jgi:hypothetical protein
VLCGILLNLSQALEVALAEAQVQRDGSKKKALVECWDVMLPEA